MTKGNGSTDRVERTGVLRWVRLSDMKVSPVAQREKLDAARVERIAREFDPDKFGTPSLNHRDGTYWIVDGWHRTEGARIVFGDDQMVQCMVRFELSDAEMAEWSDGVNDYRRWNSMDTFMVRKTAGRDVECDIDRIVRAQGLVISRQGVPNKVRAVATLRKIYERSGASVLARSLRIVRDAFGESGLEGPVLEGIALVCQRYERSLDDATFVQKLSSVHGGVNGLLGKAQQIKLQTGAAKTHCVAAAAVDINNRGRGGRRLPSWWKS